MADRQSQWVARAWPQALSVTGKGAFPAALLALTLVTGLVDAFSFLVLGDVFVANMTGNVVFLGFALAGGADFSIEPSLWAVVAFAAGAALGGRLVRLTRPDPGRLLAVTALVGAGLIGAAAITAPADAPALVATRYAAIVLLALAMGMQNATARRLAVADLTTTVLTLTITGLAADGRVGAGGSARLGPRSLAIGSMFIGALAGAVLITTGDRRWCS